MTLALSRLGPFSLVILMALVAIAMYVVLVPLHELGHVLIGAVFYGQHPQEVEWFNATAWFQASFLGRSTVLGYVILQPPDPTPQESFVQLTLFHGLWNVGSLVLIAFVESRILKAWEKARRPKP